ncbi:hypothetical protein Mapa_015125 [Marchantia paleacea]|nr:hypothetical protein Mapa_015125 [Marchantia paleacea]
MEQAKAKEPSLDECLKLLGGKSDEQRLAGLLLVTKFVKVDDLDAVRKVFDAIGFQFINRLINTSEAGQSGKARAEQRSYLHLALSILAAFCRVPELASLDETISKVPVLLQTLANKDHEAATHDCFEALLLIATASEMGLRSIAVPIAVPVVAHRLSSSPSEASWTVFAVRLLHCLLTRIAAENAVREYAQNLALVILPVARQLCVKQDIAKFEALAVLYSLLVSDISMPVRVAIGTSPISPEWAALARTGLGQILHSRVAVEQKHIVLELAQAIVEVVSEAWLVGPMVLPGEKVHSPPDRFFLLIVETLRVESAVLLNEVARSSFDPGQEPQTSDGSSVKERRLMSCFALLESVINIVTNQEDEDKKMNESSLQRIDETVLQKMLIVVDEVVGLVIELLEDAQARNQNEGEILVACVRISSRYLAEAPSAHRERCLRLLGFMLAVTAKDNERSFAVMQFMLPFLTQITLSLDGCTALVACNGHKKLASYLAWTVHNQIPGAMVDSCDVLLNILSKKDEIAGISAGEFASVLPPLAASAGQRLSDMENYMATSVCVSILALTSEDALRRRVELGAGVVNKIILLIAKSVENIAKVLQAGESLEQADEADLWDMILAGCVTCVKGRPLYPSLQKALRRVFDSWSGGRHLTAHSPRAVTNTAAILELLATMLAN